MADADCVEEFGSVFEAQDAELFSIEEVEGRIESHFCHCRPYTKEADL